MKKVYVITPVLNEEPNMPNLIGSWKDLVKELKEFEFSFILVDDGSTDNTIAVAKKLAGEISLEVLSYGKNMGPGYAFGEGFAYLAGKINSTDIVVTIEGDNTSRLETLKIMLGRIVRENVDVAFASPLAYGGGITNTVWYKFLLGHISSALTKIILKIRGLHTFTSFFRAYQGYVILTLQKAYGNRILEFNGFECMVELLKKIIIFRFSITEVPMTLDTSLRKGKSKLKIIKTSRKYFSVFYKARSWEKANKIN
jgi:dolichol-phosphate mannosyltransferase